MREVRERGSEYTLGGMQNPTSIRRATAAALATIAALVLSACGGSDAVHTVDAATFLQQTQAAGVTVIDVRTPEEFGAGHIEGAINIDVEGGSFDAGIADLDTSKTYAVYCHSGRRSGIAASTMADAGFSNVYNLDGGIIAWGNAGYTLVTG